MQKIDRNQLANAKIAGGCCDSGCDKGSSSSTPVPR
jgi:hypothetical protein